MDFHNIRLETFCHQTEDEKKVLDALLFLVPLDLEGRKDLEVERAEAEGSFGNRIVTLSLTLQKQRDIRAVLGHIATPEVCKDVLGHLDSRIDGTRFELRLDKQAAFEKRVESGASDPVKLTGKIAAYPANRENAEKLMKSLWSKLLSA